MSRRSDERARPDEVVEQRLGEGRAFGRVRSRPELVEEDERPGPGRLDDPGDGAEMTRERRERLGDRLLVADVGEDVAQDRQAAARLGRHVEAGLVHERQQPEGPQRDGLAAGVRARDDERRVAVADPDVDRDDPSRQAGMAGAEEGDLGPVRRLGPDPVELRGELGLRGPEVETGQRIERLAERRGVSRDQRRQLVEDPLDLLLLGDLCFPPRISELDRDEGLDEERLAAARGVVDDALDPATGLPI